MPVWTNCVAGVRVNGTRSGDTTLVLSRSFCKVGIVSLQIGLQIGTKTTIGLLLDGERFSEGLA